MKLRINALVAIVLSISMLAACTSAPNKNSVLPRQGGASGGTPAAALIAQAEAETAAIKESLKGQANVVETAHGAQIFVHGILEDTIQRHSDGTATHAFANGSTVKETRYVVPVNAGVHPFSNIEENSAACDDLSALISADHTRIDWAIAALILALGETVVATILSAGTLASLGALGTLVVVTNYFAAVSALDAAEVAYAAAGC